MNADEPHPKPTASAPRGPSRCPTHDELLRLVEADSDSDLRWVEDHLSECPACLRAFLDATSASTTNWPYLEGLLAPDNDASVAWRAETANAGKLPELPRHQLTREVGRGACGVVYEARHLELDRTVAIKMLVGGAFVSPEVLTRFRREAMAAARLDHPAIVQVYGVGEHEGLPFLSMQFIDGPSLRDFAKGRPQPPRAAAQLVAELSAAMHTAHQRGVVHRDLKPANILLAADKPGARNLEDHRPKIVDFGLAAPVRDDSITVADQLLGTPQYMAPEQARSGDDRDAPTVDVYALGAVLYELLVGRAPHVGKGAAEILRSVMENSPTPPRKLAPQTPRDLQNITLCCLEKEPSKRYASCAALAEDLQRFLEFQPVHARPSGPLTRLSRWRRRRPLAAVSLALAAIATAGVGVAAYQARLAHRANARAAAAAESVALGDYRSKLRHACESLATEDRIAARKLLSECDPHRRSWAWGLLNRLATQRPPAQSVHEGAVGGLVVLDSVGAGFSAGGDGRLVRWPSSLGDTAATIWQGEQPLTEVHTLSGERLATLDAAGVVRRHNPAAPAGAPEELSHAQPITHIFGSAKSGILYLRDASEAFHRWAPGAASAVAIELAERPAGVLAIGVSANETVIAAVTDSNRLLQWDLREAARPPLSTKLHPSPLTGARFLPDGDSFAGFHDDQTARVYSLQDSQHPLSLFGHRDAPRALARSADGRWVATGGEDGSVRVWQIDKLNVSRSVAKAGSPVTALAFAESGQQILVADGSGSVQLAPTQLTPLQAALSEPVVAPLPASFRRVRVSPSGLHVGTAGRDGHVRIWRTSDFEPVADLLHPQPTRDFAFPPGEATVYTACEDGLLREWRVADGTLIRQFPTGDKAVISVAISHDGRFLATGSGGITNETPDLVDGPPVRVWDLQAAELLHTWRSHNHAIRCLRFGPHGLLVSTGGSVVRLWDANRGVLLHELHGHSARVFSATFTADGSRLATCATDNNAMVWDVNTGERVGNALSRSTCVRRTPDRPCSVGFAPDRRSRRSAGPSCTEASRTGSSSTASAPPRA